jgi:hypothetical protein
MGFNCNKAIYLDKKEIDSVNERLERFKTKIKNKKIFYSKKGLSLWHGAATFFEHNEGYIQLHPRLKNKKKLYGLYTKEEILAHEWIHITRGPLNAYWFEEVIAYQTSPNKLRRFLGPLFNPIESLGLILISCASLAAQWIHPLFLWMPFFYFSFCFAKLCILQLFFLKAKKRLKLGTLLHLDDYTLLQFS